MIVANPRKADMVLIPGGRFHLGSDDHYPEERPARLADIASFAIDRSPVTNAAFEAFVSATGWETVAERVGSSSVFHMTLGPVALYDPDQWWRATKGASWRYPEGPESSIENRRDHPVVHIALEDAEAFAAWRGCRLPSEAEWEAAARGGLQGAIYGWGNEFAPRGGLMANIWTGSFPWYFAREGGPGTSAIGAFPANVYGLVDMIGNVWEWTASDFDGGNTCGCAAGQNAVDKNIALKGGSFLCAGEYCQRYRPAARMGVRPGATASHIGFRCALDA